MGPPTTLGGIPHGGERMQRSTTLRRDLGFWSALLASEGAIIGSGWLFGAYTAASLAGPSAIISWILASAIMLLLALVHAELGSMYSIAGGTSRYPHFAFGSFAGAAFGWFSYIQAATVAPIEVLATIQYLSSLSWAHGWVNANGTLSGTGIVVAMVLMAMFVTLNLIGVRWMSRTNDTVTVVKVAVPVFTIVVLAITSFHASNFSRFGFFVPGHSGGFKAVMTTISIGGIIFALSGFEQAIQLGGETNNPSRNVPRAVIFSMVIGVAIYVAIQVIFIAALDPRLLLHAGSWSNLASTGELPRAPFTVVCTAAGLGWMGVILRTDAIISPAGAGLVCMTSASRIAYGLAQNGYLPSSFAYTSKRTKVPFAAILVTWFIGLIFLLPFPSWNRLVGVSAAALVLMYAGAPLALGAFRTDRPDAPRAYKIPAAKVLAPLAFVVSNFAIYWAGWQTYSTLMIVTVIGFMLFGITRVFGLNERRLDLDLRGARWMLPYLVGMGIISYAGGFGRGGIIGWNLKFTDLLVGGNADLPLYVDLAVLTVFSLAIYALAQSSRLNLQTQDRYIAQGTDTAEIFAEHPLEI